MKKILLIAILFSFIGCQDNIETPCVDVTNPLEELSWLNQIKTNLENIGNQYRIRITQYTYNNEPVFMIDECVDCPDYITKIYNCSGNIICEFGGIDGKNTCGDFNANATNEVILWESILLNQGIIIDNDLYSNTNTNNYTITNVTINENYLKITVKSNGCSRDTWKATLIDADQILESNPVQRFLKLSLEKDELWLCQALFEKEFTFDLTKIQIDGDSLFLNISGFDDKIYYPY